MEAKARHLFVKWFFQWWTLPFREEVCVINSPAAHDLPIDLRWKIPHVARNVSKHRKEVKICPLAALLFLPSCIYWCQHFQHARRMHRRLRKDPSTCDSIGAIRANDDLC